MLATITLRKPTDAEEVARFILQSHAEARVFAFVGDLGAGKTTLIKALCQVLGVADHTSSPSFAIVNEYRTGTGDPLYHFDLYRLKAEEELEGIGFDEYLDSGYFCFIEWPELAEAHLPPDTLHVRITAAANGVRTIELSRNVASNA
ncbi:MAG TPA: tRNA (adenosine(37)-N6)-threonylcarbamoyltransferase complex ATPase subunit type 1 TsaE [Flavobacteriales bacterium]|nr:tRNA (adenosine(37)-N6)-threonylcarbamoyltransferase complex ATPase subunit type 1 TsaE [Flavobacteriales bacterium]